MRASAACPHLPSAGDPAQDPNRVPHWFTKYQLQYQSAVGVYVIEDRFQGEEGRRGGGRQGGARWL
jgi:hypothetical protein